MILNICIYCGERGSSREHVWPQWLRKHASTVMKISPANFQTYLGTQESVIAAPVHNWRKEGHSRLSLTIQHPCEECNTGWMHDLEDAAIPILKPMIEGKKTRLSKPEVKIVRAWATKTALHFLYDGEDQWKHPIPPHLATNLFEGRHDYTPVPGVQVWTALYNPLRMFTYRHMSALGYGEHPQTAQAHVVLRSVFIAGHAIFYVRLPDSPDAQGLGWKTMNPSQRNLICLLVVLVRMACGGVVLVRGGYRMAKCSRAEQGCRVGAPVAAYANKSSVGDPGGA